MISILLSQLVVRSELADELERLSVRVINWPAPRTTEPEDYLALDEAIENLFGYDWLILKNPTAVESFLRRFERQHQPSELDELRVMAIGEDVAKKLVDSSIHIDVTLDRFSLAKAFDEIASYTGDRDSLSALNFLIPSANLVSELVEQQLSLAGARVDNVKAYATTTDVQQLIQLKALIVGGGVDCIVFTSAFEVAEFAQLVDTDNLSQTLGDIAVVCTGREAHEAAAQFGLPQSIWLFEPTTGALANQMIRTLSAG